MTGEVLMQQDPVTFEVVRGGLYAICEEMKSVMMRASFSPLLSLSADLSCAILDQKGDVVAQALAERRGLSSETQPRERSFAATFLS